MNNRTTPRDFFLHLGATLFLYAVIIALINLCFSTINYAFPDVLAGNFYATSIVWPTSMLIVLTPVLYILEWLIAKDLRANPLKADLWIRRWRIYLTIFLSGLTIAGDLIALINTFLSGEITSRFVYKVIVVLVVTFLVFAYYMLERKVKDQRNTTYQKILSISGIIIVLAAIVFGFTIIGSPMKQRAVRLDQQRVYNLTSIQWQIINYWQQKKTLPRTLAELNDSISGFVAPVDPVSKENYVYQIVDDNSFKLCANFAEPSQNNSGKGADYGTISYPAGPVSMDENWNHATGTVCFQRNIDPERFPPVPNGK